MHLLDDDADIRESVGILLTQNGYSVHKHASADAFLTTFLPHRPGSRPMVVITDVEMPGRSGLALLHDLRPGQEGPGQALRIILLSGHACVPLAVQAMRSGAAHVIEKPADPDLLLKAVKDAFADLEQGDPKDPAAAERLRSLTPREREVLASFVTRGSNKGVANALRMSPRTVEVHRSRIVRKSGASSVPELVRIAIAAGIVEETSSSTHA
ncbi:response regulator transcription factor [Roseomonas sp. HF4]|uniref:response regulator transcription factor n=1 Tax=Roseomonas sp. HF4 TaxID=2562313 RepID=UPI001484FDC5|nr:response regulator [Roseomonas sp. HF4]